MFQNIINNLYTPKTSIFVHNTLTVYVILYYSVVVHDILNNVEETFNSKISDKVLGYYFLYFSSYPLSDTKFSIPQILSFSDFAFFSDSVNLS